MRSAFASILTTAAALSCGGEGREVEGARPAGARTTGLTASIAVEPFTATGAVPTAWTPKAFAESLTVRLSGVEWLNARLSDSGRGDDDFLLEGGVALRDHRVVITPRLLRRDGTDVWTATFWRSDVPIDNVVGDVATAVVEALVADVARRTLRANKE